ncbi:MAG: recombination mediator RecR [Candidatus Shapirobacteria bacterium]|nr:recombination mediator RecR [Candidatus Shapirobacteria bacterium]MDD3002258.1 recombination mediator RecR [Candidatus Shapirobacteria bacterium]MDD4382737.1 recombination mediator RecR [Candidatus Shapirobacteria bacterium]
MAAELPKSIKNLIAAFERLPGIGPKSASRLVFYLINTPESYVMEIARSLLAIKKEVKVCKECFSVCEGEICSICEDKERNKKIICVVERAIDVMAIENIGGYKGVYHVLGGVVNPLEHVSPDDLKIDELIKRVEAEMEIILATNPTMEGEATALYIKKKIDNLGKNNIKISRIGSGLPMGADLEYADQATLSRAMEGRREI